MSLAGGVDGMLPLLPGGELLERGWWGSVGEDGDSCDTKASAD